MRKSKLDTPHVKKEVIQLATGESQSSIAQDIGVNRSQVSRFARREDDKPFLEQELMKLLEAVRDAVENIKKLVMGMQKIPQKDTRRRELAYKPCVDILRAGGIMPNAVQSPVITNIFQQNNHFSSTLVQEILQKYMTSSLVNWKPDGWAKDDHETP
jgi:hypothetical protein